MIPAGLKDLAANSRLPALLDQIGLWSYSFRSANRVLELIRSTGRNGKRDDLSQAIEEDFEACHEKIGRVACDVPAGDPRCVCLMISSYPTVWGIKLEAMLSLAARMAGFGVQILDLGGSRDLWAYHRAFGNDRLVRFTECLLLEPILSPNGATESSSTMQYTVQDLMKLTYHDVDAGRIVMSNVMYRHKFTQFDLSKYEMQLEVAEELARVHRNIRAAERLLAKVRPVQALVLEKGLSPSAEVAGVCLAKGIPLVQYSNSQDMNGFVLKRFTMQNRHNHPFSLDASTWGRVKCMNWGSQRESELMGDLENGYKLGTWFNRKFLHQDKRFKSAEAVREQLGLDPAKKTAVIFSHVLWDATFFYGEGLFNDYETWFVETVRAACRNPTVNWVVKLHPDLLWKLKLENYSGELRDLVAMKTAVGSLPENVKIVMPDTDISTHSFFDITDYCLTVRGTIGIEMSCHGVPVLTAGTGRYSNLGFTIDSLTAEEYIERLAHIETISPMAPREIELARRFAYALFKLRPWHPLSFETTKMPIEMASHPLAFNLLIHAESSGELAASPDIRSLVDWLMSDQADYVELPA